MTIATPARSRPRQAPRAWPLRRALGLLFSLLTLLPWAVAPASAATEPAGVQLTYLANEGFLLEAGETRVLVDSLFGDGLRGYPTVPAPLRSELEGARGRFAGIDLVLASHFHGDHFDAAAVARHLTANPGVRFVSTHQAVAKVRGLLDEGTASRVSARLPDEGTTASLELPGVTVTFLNLHHGRDRSPPVENLGLVIELGGLRFLHVGDTMTTAADLEPYRELLDRIDVALVPSWLLGRARWREIARRNLVVMHLAAPDAPPSWFGPAGNLEAAVAELREELPGAWVPLEPLATRTYAPATP